MQEAMLLGENSKCYQETKLADAFTELGKAMPIMPSEMEVAPPISCLMFIIS